MQTNEKGIAHKQRDCARLCLTVAAKDAEPLRRALFDQLYGYIQRIVVVPAREPGSREPSVGLVLVLMRDAVEAALHIVMITTDHAEFGRVAPTAA
jgi:hypothetical protein